MALNESDAPQEHFCIKRKTEGLSIIHQPLKYEVHYSYSLNYYPLSQEGFRAPQAR